MTFMAATDTTQRQRVTTKDPDKVDVEDEREVEDNEDEYVCAMGCTDGCKAAKEALANQLRKDFAEYNFYNDLEDLGTGIQIGLTYVYDKTVKKIFNKVFGGKKNGGVLDMRKEKSKDYKSQAETLQKVITELGYLEASDYFDLAITTADTVGAPPEAAAALRLAREAVNGMDDVKRRLKQWESHCDTQWRLFYLQHKQKQIKRKRNCGSTPTY